MNGVSISRKPCESRYWRAAKVTRERSMMLRCIRGRRRSTKRYFRRMSSETSTLSSMGNGGVLDSLRIHNFSAITSTSPVGMVALMVSALRSSRWPSMAATYSERRHSALPCTVASRSSWKTTCMTPSRSRKCMKMTPPRSRRRCTQPISSTRAPASAALNWPHVCVRRRSPKKSKETLSCILGFATQLPVQLRGAHSFLRARFHIL